MKIKLTQPGFEGYTAQMGTVFFENGLSVADVKPVDAVRIAAQFLCEWEDGTSVSVAQSILDHAHATTHSIPQEQNADQALAAEAAAGNAAAEVVMAEPKSDKVYTAMQLAEIADKDGIKGLRAIAETFGIKGNSITELQKAILDKQAKA